MHTNSMRAVYYLLLVVLARQATCATVRNTPSFSKPVYSNSYLPAAMQVIFHAVEQLKTYQLEETVKNYTSISISTTPINQSTNTEPFIVQHSSTMATSTQSEEEIKGDEKEDSNIEETTEYKTVGLSNDKVDTISKDEDSQDDKIQETMVEKMPCNRTAATSTDKINDTNAVHPSQDKIEDLKMKETSGSFEADGELATFPTEHQESPEVNAETPETNYATSETNYEVPENVYAISEANEEVTEDSRELNSPIETKLQGTTTSEIFVNSTTQASVNKGDHEKEKKPTVDSVTKNIYEVLKPSTSKFIDENGQSSEESENTTLQKMEILEEDSDESRFTQLGEKVTQVPRPSLSSYLRRSKFPPSATLQQLANLYDSLSKDAKKQGFGKYTGYSDEVLNTLKTSAEGGMGPQMKKILDKVLEHNELTREDARMRTSQAVRDLDNPSSTLSKELRPLLPLRYSP